jgi:hypothetical protein
MITPSYAITATERVLPRLALDFTTATLDPRVTFTRTGNTATVVNSLGLVAPINANLPRFDFDPVTLVCKGLLIEESRINYCLYSADFSNIVWTVDTSGGSLPVVTGNYAVAPDGTTTAARIQLNRGAGTFSRFQQVIGPLTSGTYTDSIWMKTTSGSGTANVGLRNAGTGINCVVTGQWQRFSVTNTPAATAPSLQVLLLSSIPGNDVTADILVWGGQVELGAFATSYIPTEATAVTRNADVATMTGTNFSDWYNQSEGTFFGQALLGGSAQLAAVGTVRNTTSDAIVYGFLGASQTTCQIWVGGVNQADLGPARNINAVNGVCLAYKVNDVIVSNNGGATLSDNTSLIPTVNAFYIGQNRVTTTSCIHIQKIAYYPQRLTNNEVLAFSKV